MSILNFFVQHLWLVGVLFFVAVAYYGMASTKRKEKYARKTLKKTIESGMNEPQSLHPVIDPTKCAGCGACVKVCPEGDIMQMINNKAALVKPSKCVGHGECEKACPFGAIDLVFGTKSRGIDIPRLTGHYETNIPGLYIAGELGGMGLIRNAIKQGHLAADNALKNLKSQSQVDCDLFIVGAGPAGLAACLTAIVHKKKYICIEQNSVGGTVYNFPRQKVVMSHPAELPGIGTMKFPTNKISKEELLKYWNSVRKKAGVKINEKVKFESLEKNGDIFVIKTSSGEYKSPKVILAMGVRGSPRKLGLPNEDSGKVAYNLVDPQEYKNMAVAVVGGGNAGVEAAQMLANPKLKNDVTLLVRGDIMDRCNDENKKIIEDMARKNLVKIWYNSEVKEIQKDTIKVKKGDQLLDIKNQFLFVFAGAEMPYKYLMSLGVKIEKAFGERGVKSS